MFEDLNNIPFVNVLPEGNYTGKLIGGRYTENRMGFILQVEVEGQGQYDNQIAASYLSVVAQQIGEQFAPTKFSNAKDVLNYAVTHSFAFHISPNAQGRLQWRFFKRPTVAVDAPQDAVM